MKIFFYFMTLCEKCSLVGEANFFFDFSGNWVHKPRYIDSMVCLFMIFCYLIHIAYAIFQRREIGANLNRSINSMVLELCDKHNLNVGVAVSQVAVTMFCFRSGNVSINRCSYLQYFLRPFSFI